MVGHNDMRWVGLILYPLLQITFDSLISVIKYKVQMIFYQLMARDFMKVGRLKSMLCGY